MEKKQVQEALKVIKDNSTKRNFKQTIDLIINLKGLDLKKQDNKVDVYAQLHFDRGKRAKICGLVGPELLESAKNTFDTVITVDDFSKYQNKRAMKKLSKEHSFFVAQANVMPKVATTFGRVLGPHGKMPNPKAGCVVPPNANLAPLAEKLQKTVRIRIDTSPVFQTYVGVEDMEDDKIVDNVLTIYNTLLHSLPNEDHNIKSIYLKLTMGKAYRIGEQSQQPEKDEKQKAKPIKAEAEKSE